MLSTEWNTIKSANDGLASAEANMVVMLDLSNPDPQKWVSVRCSVDTEKYGELLFKYGPAF